MHIASFVIQPPEAFCFATPAEWPNWKKRFERFHTASGLYDKPGSQRVDTRLHLMGDQAEDIFGTFNLSEEKANNLEVVLQQFGSYFNPRRNVIFEHSPV